MSLLRHGWGIGLDPATALVIAVAVGYHAFKLIRKIIAALRSRDQRLPVVYDLDRSLRSRESPAVARS